MNIYLVRHGESRANVDWTENQRTADHAIELTNEGHRQAQLAGGWLREHFVSSGVLAKPTLSTPADTLPRMALTRLWLSPYTRTRQTADAIEAACRGSEPFEIGPPGRYKAGEFHNAGDSLFLDRREHLLLAEQQFGLFDGMSDEEREARYPAEYAYYEKCKRFEGKLWPQMPLGESRFEVCQRVHQAFGTFRRDAEKHGIKTIVVVAHGTVNRAFTMMWLHKPYEWMDKESNPANCSIRLLEDGEDKGFIFEGFENPDGYKPVPNKEAEE